MYIYWIYKYNLDLLSKGKVSGVEVGDVEDIRDGFFD